MTCVAVENRIERREKSRGEEGEKSGVLVIESIAVLTGFFSGSGCVWVYVSETFPFSFCSNRRPMAAVIKRQEEKEIS